MARVAVVLRPVERHERVAFAILVVHFVAFVDRNPVHLDGATVFGGHQDFRAHDLPCKREKEVVKIEWVKKTSSGISH